MAGERDSWSSKLGFILAASGSAVGLGNVWRFPYVTYENGGAAFVLLYVFFVAMIGLPVMLLELSVGRLAQSNPIGAFHKLARGPWIWVGYMFVLTGVAILSYYGVIAGWTVGYLVKALFGDMDPSAFKPFIANPTLQIGYLVFFLCLTGVVVSGGVRKGIEKVTSLLMPILVLLIMALIVRGLFSPQAMDGLRFFFVPDFSKVTPKTFVYATGQAFFSLSLGMGAMITYGSYLSKKDNLLTSGAFVVGFDTMIALLAGLLIFPVTGGLMGEGGPTLAFVTLIDIFNGMLGGEYVGIVFFLLLAIAALTSTVSLLEVATAHFVDDRGWKRRKSVIVVTAAAIILGIPSALSSGGNAWLSGLFGRGFFGTMDFLFGNIALTFGAFLLCVFAAFKLKNRPLVEEVEVGCPGFAKSFLCMYWKVMVSLIAPLIIAFLLVYVLVTGEGLG